MRRLLRRHSELAENIGQDIDVDALGKLADDASTLEYECMEFANTLEVIFQYCQSDENLTASRTRLGWKPQG